MGNIFITLLLLVSVVSAVVVIGPLLGPTEFRNIPWVSWLFRPLRQLILLSLSAFLVWLAFLLFSPDIPGRTAYIKPISALNSNVANLESVLQASDIDSKNLEFDVLPRSNFLRIQARVEGTAIVRNGDIVETLPVSKKLSSFDFSSSQSFFSTFNKVSLDRDSILDHLVFEEKEDSISIKYTKKDGVDELMGEIGFNEVNLSEMNLPFTGTLFLELIYFRALDEKKIVFKENKFESKKIIQSVNDFDLNFSLLNINDNKKLEILDISGRNYGNLTLPSNSIEVSNTSIDDFYKIIIRFKKNEITEKEILKVSPALTFLQGYSLVDNLVNKGLWPFKQIEFGTGPYTSSALLAESSSKDLSSGDIDKVRQLIDKQITSLPSPTDTELSMGRRLVGDIQLLCYFLFSYASLLIIFSYLATVRPNNKLRNKNSHIVTGFSVDRYSDPNQKGQYWWRLRSELDEKPDDENIDITEKHIPSPWLEGSALRATPSEYEKLYSTLGDSYGRKVGLYLLKPLIPLTELRRIGYMALSSSPSAENVPNFVSVEADGFYETYEAQNKIIQYLIWAIPTLGFIGTVLGIGDALSATVDIQSNVLSVRADAESKVGSNIGLAFDTTFVALMLSFFLMLFFYLLQKSQELMISREKRHTLSEIIRPENLVNTMSASSIQSIIAKLGDDIGVLTDTVQPEERPYPSSNQVISKKSNKFLGFIIFLVLIGAAVFILKNYYPSELSELSGVINVLVGKLSQFIGSSIE